MDKRKQDDMAPWRAAAISGPLKRALGEEDSDAAQLPEDFREILDRLSSAEVVR